MLKNVSLFLLLLYFLQHVSNIDIALGLFSIVRPTYYPLSSGPNPNPNHNQYPNPTPTPGAYVNEKSKAKFLESHNGDS